MRRLGRDVVDLLNLVVSHLHVSTYQNFEQKRLTHDLLPHWLDRDETTHGQLLENTGIQ
jgi:hypothetical protein